MLYSKVYPSIFLVLLGLFTLKASPLEVTISVVKEKSTLMVSSNPFKIKGVGGNGDLNLLKSTGANAIRTWGIDDNTKGILDEAHALGIKVVLGYWLGHERHGFDYSDWDSTKKQAEDLFSAVKRFKDHPALLIWALGNEMEGFTPESNPAIYNHIEYLAREVKKVDTFHPVMTVTAEIGKRQVEALNRYCPSIDIHGINSYGGVTSLSQRYRKAGGKKPFIVTEYGQPGTWEMKKNPWGMYDEPSSTTKGEYYKNAYESVDSDPLCLGSFAFTWGSKQEASATWFGMLLPSGEKLECVDLMTQLWSGRKPKNLCPKIHSLSLLGPNETFNQGDLVTVKLEASDPEQDDFDVEWVLSEDWQEEALGGDYRPTPPFYADAILSESNKKIGKIRIPDNGGTYRIYAYVRDGQGGGATANISINVNGERKPVKAESFSLPLPITGNDKKSPYAPSGWMGNFENLKFEEVSESLPKEGRNFSKISYPSQSGWAGIVWQHPIKDWGDSPGGFDLSGAKELSFWAKGQKGGEKITFGIGIIGKEKPYHDSTKQSLELILSSKWVKYKIDLTEEDLTRIKSPFYFSTAANGQPLAFYLNEVVIK